MLRSYRLEGIQFQCCWNKVLYVGATTKDDGAVGGWDWKQPLLKAVETRKKL